MLGELRIFVSQIARRHELWKAQELWLAAALGLASFVWFRADATLLVGLRSHFGDLLTLTSIAFGFVLTSLFFYVQVVGQWGDSHRVKRIAEKLIDWHVWTVICLLILMAYVVFLWAIGTRLVRESVWYLSLHSIMVFLTVYPALQVVNHVLTIWWLFHNRDVFSNGKADHPKGDPGDQEQPRM